MNRVQFCLAAMLTLVSFPLSAKEPDLSGTWTLSSMTVFENGISQKMDLELFGKKLNAGFQAKRSKAGYSVVPIQVEDNKVAKSFDLKIKESGKNFIGEYIDGETKFAALVHITPAELRAIVNPKSPNSAPQNFETPTDKSEVRIDLTFKRSQAVVVVWVKGPQGADVSIGDWSETLKDVPLGVITESLPTERETPFDVSLQVSAGGQTTKDRIRVWAAGGTEPEADFSDIRNPDTAVRTLRYWESCTKTLHRHLKDAERAANNEQRKKSLTQLPDELRTTPSRGVDVDVVNKWLALVTASDRLFANQRRVEDGDLAVEAFLRGLAGDPFGAARDAQRRGKADLEGFGKSFIDLKNMAPILTAKYGSEFPIP